MLNRHRATNFVVCLRALRTFLKIEVGRGEGQKLLGSIGAMGVRKLCEKLLDLLFGTLT